MSAKRQVMTVVCYIETRLRFEMNKVLANLIDAHNDPGGAGLPHEALYDVIAELRAEQRRIDAIMERLRALVPESDWQEWYWREAQEWAASDSEIPFP